MKHGFAFGVVILIGCGLLLLPLLNQSSSTLQVALLAEGLSLLSRYRRLSVASPSFSLLKPAGSNFADVSSGSSNVVVIGGPTYASFTITASSGLGNSANTRVKLVSSSTTASDCSAITSAAPSPLDGTVAPSAFSATSDTFTNVKFPTSGLFKICYFNPSLSAYEVLPVTITVDGAVPSNDHFCIGSSSIKCTVKITGTGLLTTYRIGVIAYSSTAACGTSALTTTAFGNQLSSLLTLQSTSSKQVYDFALPASASAATYLLCLCPAFDADNSGGACQTGSAADFAQNVGKLFLTSVSANVTSIYNGLAINLVVHCGTGVGGCTSGFSNRYKIVNLSTSNDVATWDSERGCGAALQTQNQIKPRNCLTSVMCQHRTATPSSLTPTWNSLVLETNMEHSRHVATTFDVCYCNDNCVATTRWFKVGQIQVAPITVLGPSVVNTLANVDLQGPGGSWMSSGTVLKREMKLLSDPYGSVSNAQCYDVPQSTQLVGDHLCTSTLDCYPPYSAAVGQTYIGVTLKAAGYFAVCYCNSECGDREDWFVQGHLLVAGPLSGQTWSFYTSVSFQLEVMGWKLTTSNRIMIIDSTVQCTDAGVSQVASISGPTTVAPLQSSGSAGDITSIAQYGSQTKIVFAADHGLVSGARISVTGVTCGACSAEESSRFNANHRVTSVLGSKEVVVSLTFSGAYPVTVTSSATWFRDDLQTYASLKASQPGKYRVCWSASVVVPQSVAATVGILHVASAPAMTASLHSSTIQPATVAPIVLTFTTSNTNRYQAAVGSMRLRIVFVSPTLLMPHFVDETAVAADTSLDTIEEASQRACSKWILELGTARNPVGLSNELGWPMPKGCYFAQEGSSWAFTLVFEPKNGLKQYQTYDIVMNAALGTAFATTSDVIQLFSLDDVDQVLEAGSAVVGNGAATILRSGTDAQFHTTDGFRILNGANGYVALTSGSASFEAQLRAASGTEILQDQLIRLFLRPLTQWVIGYACFVTCTPFSGQICGTPSCLTESVMDRWYHRNILRIKMPAGMTGITDIIKHRIQVSNLATPPGGFFPIRWGAEVQPTDGQKPDYVDTSVAELYLRPALTIAAVVTKLGDGNVKPFHGDMANTLYVKVMLGATLFAPTSGDAILRVVLPSGYECISGGAAPSTLDIFSGQVPTANGILRDGATIPSWTAVPASGAATARCELQFAANMALYAGVMVYFALTVNNPSAAVSPDAVGNLWQLELSGKGTLTSLVTAPFLGFQNINANLSQSVSVLGRLTDASIVPSNFERGFSGNWLTIFFRTAQAVAAGGSVQVDSPGGFAVGDICEVQDLPAFYYSKFDLSLSAQNISNATLRLPFTTCIGVRLPSSSSTNSAKITLSSGLWQDAFYAFMLSVTNPLSYHVSQLNSWHIQTNAPGGFGIDRSFYTVRLNGDEMEAAQSSWGMYNHQIGPSGFEVYIADMRPSGLPTKVRVMPIIFDWDVTKKVRIIAPVGYVWSFSSAEFVYRKHSAGLTTGQYVQGVEGDMPISAPPLAPMDAPYNLLEFNSISGYFHWGVKYGFEARVVLPQYSPSSSANVFILQAGYDDIAQAGTQAAMAEAPFVRRVSDVVVGYKTSLQEQENTVVIDFRTLTEIPMGGSLVLRGPAGFNAPAIAHPSCSLSLAPGIAMALPSHSCSLGSFSDEVVAMVNASAVISENSYKLTVSVRNPSNSGITGYWRLASYSQAYHLLDYEGDAPSFLVSTPMQGGAMVSGQYCMANSVSSCATVDQQYQKTGRDDRPGAQNNLIFAFNLSSNSTPGQFVIRAPLGFQWSAECTVVTGSTAVFGSYTLLPGNFSAWPDVTVTNCVGRENIATFYMSHDPDQGFLGSELYVFRINSVTNPFAAPADNYWALEVSGEASVPFSGFDLWTLSHLTISFRSTFIKTSNIVTLVVSFLHTVPSLGYVQIVAPGGYTIPHLCSLQLATAVAVQPWEIQKIFYAGDYNCTGIGVNTNAARLHLLKKSLLSGVQYHIDLGVINPPMVSTGGNLWNVSSYRRVAFFSGRVEYHALDSGAIQGSATNAPVSLFVLSPLPLTNALASVDWYFWLVFEEALYVTDKIEFAAPSGYSLENSTSHGCSQYHSLLGLPNTSNTSCAGPCYHTPSCNNNTLVLSFERCPSFTGSTPFGVCIQKNTRLKFSIATQNPSSTPTSNYFIAKHKAMDGAVRASSVTEAYHIIPLFGNPVVALVAAGALNVVSEAVGSQSTIRISFTSNGLAQTVRIYGTVAGESFRFSSCTPKDGTTGKSLTVNERESSKIIVTLLTPAESGASVSILLEAMGNPSQPGTSSWTVTTYSYYDAVLGPRIVVNEKLGIVGFNVLGYISVLTTSTLTPRYYAHSGSVFSLGFRSSLQLEQGDFVDIVAPRNYAFESDVFTISGDLLVADIILTGSSLGQASGVLGNYTMVSDVSTYVSTYTGNGGTAADLIPIYQKNAASIFLYKLPGGHHWAIGPTPGNQVSGQLNEGLLNTASLTGGAAVWQVGSGNASWVQAPNLSVSAVGVVSAVQTNGQKLTFRLGRALQAAATAKIITQLTLPSAEQTYRNWRLEARRSTGNITYSTNDLQYVGFNLVWEVTFIIVPALTAPKSQSTLLVAFDQERRLGATSQVRYELTAPNTFRFPASCLSPAEIQKGSSALFTQCVGSSNVAEMVSTKPDGIKGRQDTLRVELLVNMPAETPLMNSWLLSFLLDTSSIVQGSGSVAGFNIVPMTVSLTGNNQIGMAAPAYFTLRPSRIAAVGSSIHILPPENQRYRVSCYPVVQVNFPALPQCGTATTTGALVLTLQPSTKAGGGRLEANTNYTVGVGVTNNGRSIPDAMNRWTVILYDSGGAIKDSNYQVQGVPLRSFRMTVENDVLSSVISSGGYLLPDGGYEVIVKFTLTHALAGGLISALLIKPPPNFNILDNQWKISYALPTSGISLVSQGNLQVLNLQVLLSAAALPAGSHSIQVMGTVSTAAHVDTTWTFMALKGNEIVYQHVLSGLPSS